MCFFQTLSSRSMMMMMTSGVMRRIERKNGPILSGFKMKLTDLIKYSWEMQRCNVLKYGLFFTLSFYLCVRVFLDKYNSRREEKNRTNEEKKINNNTEVVSRDTENYFCCFFLRRQMLPIRFVLTGVCVLFSPHTFQTHDISYFTFRSIIAFTFYVMHP